MKQDEKDGLNKKGLSMLGPDIKSVQNICKKQIDLLKEVKILDLISGEP
jgi:hypothetical protein